MNKLIPLIFMVNAALFIAGCNSEENQISAERFCELYSMPLGTMSFSKYKGSTNGKLYIELHKMSTLGTKEWSIYTYWAKKELVKKACNVGEG